MLVICRETQAENALKVLHAIPEFEGTFTISCLNELLKTDPVILVAYSENGPAGCKMGYDRFKDGSFYSWLGGVVPEFRNTGIAQKLNDEMEKIAKEKGYSSIIFKSRNKFKAMLQFALKNGYNMVGFEEKENISESRIILRKDLN
jgi:predicted GNAT superfamily acetyltransferase